MAVGMSDATLAHAPRFIRGRPGHCQATLEGERMRRINFSRRRHPPTHPNPTRVIVAHVPRHWAAARSLAVLAEEDLAFAAAYAAEARRIAQVPTFLPAKSLKPGETLRDVGDVENRSQAFNVNGLSTSAKN